MIKKIIQYLAFYLDNLVNNLFPFSKTVRLNYKHWSKVDFFREESYIRSSVYAFIALCLILYSYIGWHFLWLPVALLLGWFIWWLLGYIKTKRNGRK